MIIRYRAKSSRYSGKYIELQLDGQLFNVHYVTDNQGGIKTSYLLTLQVDNVTSEAQIKLKLWPKTLHADNVSDMANKLISTLLYTIIRKNKLNNSTTGKLWSLNRYGYWHTDVYDTSSNRLTSECRLYSVSITQTMTNCGNSHYCIYSFNSEFRNRISKNSNLSAYGVQTGADSLLDLHSKLAEIQRYYNNANI